MPGRIEEIIVRNLIEALNDKDVDRAERWLAALRDLRRPVPGYRPSDRQLLPMRKMGVR
jgi:hypothetical protein